MLNGMINRRQKKHFFFLLFFDISILKSFFSHVNKKTNALSAIKAKIFILEMPSPRAKLIENLQCLCSEYGLTWDDQLANDIPRKWRIHGDMLLLSSSHCFTDPRWTSYIRLYF